MRVGGGSGLVRQSLPQPGAVRRRRTHKSERGRDQRRRPLERVVINQHSLVLTPACSRVRIKPDGGFLSGSTQSLVAVVVVVPLHPGLASAESVSEKSVLERQVNLQVPLHQHFESWEPH